MYGNEFGKSSR